MPGEGSLGSDESFRPRSRRKDVFFAVLATAAFLALVEGVLALAGFHYARTPRLMKEVFIGNYIYWQNTFIEQMHFDPHPTRMWTARPGFGTVNEDGFQGPRLPRDPRPGRRRILFLGDSCTNAGLHRYPDKTISLLEERGIRADPLIAGVGSYSTFQGLDFFREALVWNPDLVVVYFGWNDHWVSPEPDHRFRRLSPVETALTSTLSRLRTYQLLHRLIYPPVLPARLPRDAHALVRAARVPPDRYAANIRTMIDLARDRELPAFFIVAPMGPHIVRPDDNKRMLIGHADLIPSIHSLYADILRETVTEAGYGRLVDFSDVTFDPTLMKADGIHPTEAGHALIARRLAAAIAENMGE